jgi:hypothetical protein
MIGGRYDSGITPVHITQNERFLSCDTSSRGVICFDLCVPKRYHLEYQLAHILSYIKLTTPSYLREEIFSECKDRDKCLYEGYSESKCRLRIPLAHPRDCPFAHVQ